MCTIGPYFDDGRDSHHKVIFDAIFHEVKKYLDKVPVRLRCVLMDVIQLRESRWQKKSLKNVPSGPKKIAEIHAEANNGFAPTRPKKSGYAPPPPGPPR